MWITRDLHRNLAAFHPKIITILPHGKEINGKLNSQKLKLTVSKYITHNACIMQLPWRRMEEWRFCNCSFFVYLCKGLGFLHPKISYRMKERVKEVVNHHTAEISIHCSPQAVAISSFVFVCISAWALKRTGRLNFTNLCVHGSNCSPSRHGCPACPRGVRVRQTVPCKGQAAAASRRVTCCALKMTSVPFSGSVLLGFAGSLAFMAWFQWCVYMTFICLMNWGFNSLILLLASEWIHAVKF